jgi:ABC-2 type transport system ATP-binding protein
MELLKTENLSKRFFNKTILDDLNITIEEGRIYGLVGPNASGKTTLMKIIAGLLQPSSGSIEIDGNKVGTKTKAIVSFAPTTNHLPKWMRVKHCLNYYSDFYRDFDAVRAEEMLEFMGLNREQKIDSLSTGLVAG